MGFRIWCQILVVVRAIRLWAVQLYNIPHLIIVILVPPIAAVYPRAVELPWIFPGAPLTFNGAGEISMVNLQL